MLHKELKILKDFLIQNYLPYDDEIINKFDIYIKLLQNSPHNVTAIKDSQEIVIKHFIDSIFIAKFYKKFKKDLKIIDIGTGAGFPGIPLKILFPEIQLYLIESVKKKISFLKNLIDILDFSGIIILDERAEILAHDKTLRERFDLVLSRALAPFPILLEITSPFAKQKKEIVAYKGENVKKELYEANKALDVFNLIVKDIYFYSLPIIDHRRSLVFFEKANKTPEKYPRRPGIPQKRPIK